MSESRCDRLSDQFALHLRDAVEAVFDGYPDRAIVVDIADGDIRCVGPVSTSSDAAHLPLLVERIAEDAVRLLLILIFLKAYMRMALPFLQIMIASKAVVRQMLKYMVEQHSKKLLFLLLS